MLYSESNGFKYVQVGSLKLATGNIPDASGDTAYGYVTADPYLIKEDGTNYIQYTLWTADGEKVVREKTSDVHANKGDFISYNVGDGTTVKEVAEALTAGAVTAYAGGEDINMVQADNSAISSFANKMADDATVVYVNTADTKGVDGGKIRTASKDSNGKYIANVMYKLDSENKVEVLFVDVNNDLDKVLNPVDSDNKAAVETAADTTLKGAVTPGGKDGKSVANAWTDTATTPTTSKTIDSLIDNIALTNVSVNVSVVDAGNTNIDSVSFNTNKISGTSSGNDIADGTVTVKITMTAGNFSESRFVAVTLS